MSQLDWWRVIALFAAASFVDEVACAEAYYEGRMTVRRWQAWSTVIGAIAGVLTVWPGPLPSMTPPLSWILVMAAVGASGGVWIPWRQAKFHRFLLRRARELNRIKLVEVPDFQPGDPIVGGAPRNKPTANLDTDPDQTQQSGGKERKEA